MVPPTDPDEISAAEEAARRSRLGYHYQDLVAVSFCIEMLRNRALLKVACETQEDVVLTWELQGGGEVGEFVQVKSDRLTQQWTVAKFCEQDLESTAGGAKPAKGPALRRKDTSIFEKNALRDSSQRRGRFRIVTRADVKDFRVLTTPPDQRDAVTATTFAKELEAALGGNTSLTSGDIEYWAVKAVWEVRGSESAIVNESFRWIAEAVQSEGQRLIPAVEVERILRHIVDEARAMATGNGRCGSDPSSVKNEEFRAWFVSQIRRVPAFLGAAETAALLREERLSLARCETLWLVLGVLREDAAALARQPEVGARTDFFADLESGFHWITAAYGMGKSLAVERLFQLRLADYTAGRDARVPVFLRAFEIGDSLQATVLSRLRDLRRDDGSPPLFVILDAVDEAGIDHGHSLLSRNDAELKSGH
jgi:hypothetical protein